MCSTDGTSLVSEQKGVRMRTRGVTAAVQCFRPHLDPQSISWQRRLNPRLCLAAVCGVNAEQGQEEVQ